MNAMRHAVSQIKTPFLKRIKLLVTQDIDRNALNAAGDYIRNCFFAGEYIYCSGFNPR
jgi:hypothetical protein